MSAHHGNDLSGCYYTEIDNNENEKNRIFNKLSAFKQFYFKYCYFVLLHFLVIFKKIR